eukprot:6226536-Pyramimonas_sp.AAC.2
MTKLAVQALGDDNRGAVQAGGVDLRKGQEEVVRGAVAEFVERIGNVEPYPRSPEQNHNCSCKCGLKSRGTWP